MFNEGIHSYVLEKVSPLEIRGIYVVNIMKRHNGINKTTQPITFLLNFLWKIKMSDATKIGSRMMANSIDTKLNLQYKKTFFLCKTNPSLDLLSNSIHNMMSYRGINTLVFTFDVVLMKTKICKIS